MKIDITCEFCRKVVSKEKRSPIPRFCNVNCSSRWRAKNSPDSIPSMKGKAHSIETKRKMTKSFLRRFEERPDSISNWRSIRGWYKGLFFRSSYEYFFMKSLESKGIDLRNDIKQESFRVPYRFEGIDHVYLPDFYCTPHYAVYEVKSEYHLKQSITLEKHSAAREFFSKQGLRFFVVTESDLEIKSLSHRKIRKILDDDPCVFLLKKAIENDALDALFSQQESFMNLLRSNREFPEFPVDMSTKKGQKLVKDISHECMHELFEAVQLLKNSKDHRRTDVPSLDRSLFLEELADVLHYFVEICIVSGVTQDDLYKAYMKKGTINSARILSGY